MGLDPQAETPRQDVGRHWGLELGIADDDDDGLERALGQLEGGHEGADVKPVLVEWILKA